MKEQKQCYICQSKNLKWLQDIKEKPKVEVEYGISKSAYFRQIFECENCGTINNLHDLLNDDNFYKGEYNLAIDKNKINHRFRKIISLDPTLSDNKQRVNRVIEYLNNHFTDLTTKKILDIGSGTCVFLYEIQKTIGIETYCIDPDSNAINHALKNVKVQLGHVGTVFDFKTNLKFSIITFNKVLEHVKNPMEILKKSLEYLQENGVIYIELPESDRIINEGIISERSEFAVEHYTIHNEKSIQYFADKVGLLVVNCKKIIDPSGKFTIFAFLKKK